MIQLEELEQRWRELDRKVDATLTLGLETARRLTLHPARRRVHRLAFWPALDASFAGVVIAGCVAFLSRHASDWRAALPGVVTIAGAGALLVESLLQLALIFELDWASPVAHIQSSLDRLRARRIRQLKWVMLASPLVGFCGLVVAGHALLWWASSGQFSVVDRMSRAWIYTNYAFGVAFLAIGGVIAQRFASRFAERTWWRRFLDSLSGASLARAIADVDHWADLQRGLNEPSTAPARP